MDKQGNGTFRITRKFCDIKDVFADLVEKETGISLVIYEHESDANVSRTHVHGIIKNYPKNVITFKRLFSSLNLKSTDKSFKQIETTEERAITYASKGKLKPVFIYNYEDSYLNYCMDNWVSKDTFLQLKPIKLTLDEYRDKVIENCKTRDYQGEERFDHDNIFYSMIEVSKQTKKFYPIFQYSNVLESIQAEYQTELTLHKLESLRRRRYG